MRELLFETARVLAIGLALGVAHGVVRGWPAAPPPPPGSATCSGPVAAQPTVRWVTASDARALVGDPGVVFVDARSTEDYLRGHVTGALLAPLGETGGVVPPALLTLLRGARTVVTYCDTADGCSLSTRLAGLLAEAGIADVRVLEGGFPAWVDHDYPAEAGPCRGCP
jgi:rhodanese-related sulfurtransferase